MQRSRVIALLALIILSGGLKADVMSTVEATEVPPVFDPSVRWFDIGVNPCHEEPFDLVFDSFATGKKREEAVNWGALSTASLTGLIRILGTEFGSIDSIEIIGMPRYIGFWDRDWILEKESQNREITLAKLEWRLRPSGVSPVSVPLFPFAAGVLPVQNESEGRWYVFQFNDHAEHRLKDPGFSGPTSTLGRGWLSQDGREFFFEPAQNSAEEEGKQVEGKVFVSDLLWPVGPIAAPATPLMGIDGMGKKVSFSPFETIDWGGDF